MKIRGVNNTKKRFSFLFSMLVIISIILLTVGYSSITATSRIESIMASIRPTVDVRITNLLVSENNNGGISSNHDFNVDKVFGTIDLPSQNSSVTYQISTTVFSGNEMKITDIVFQNNNLEYEVTGYNIGDVICNNNNECNYGITKSFYLTIKYKNGAFDNTNTSYNFQLDFIFEEVLHVAKIGNNYYSTLQGAINDVANNNVEVTIKLLRDTAEVLTVGSGKRINFDLQNFTVSSYDGKPIIENYGHITISNGRLSTSAAQGAININTGGSLTMTGGTIIATGSKQTIYNNGGDVLITGSAYLRNYSNSRASVQNESGNMTITGGTIISDKYSGVLNKGTLIIGIKDGSVNGENPVIQGLTYGVDTTSNFRFFDGILKGKNKAISDVTKVQEMENNYSLFYSSETIGTNNYETVKPAIVVNVTFDANLGEVSEISRVVEYGKAIGNLPIPTRENHFFDGWFTDPDVGDMIDQNYIVTEDLDLFAHWTHVDDAYSASINGVQYKTLTAAIEAAPNNTETTITLLRNVIENVTVPSNKKLILDFQPYTLTSAGNDAVIVNKGTTRMISGTISTSSTSTAAINNEASGNFTISGGSIIATGQRQAIYNNGGTTLITGSAYLKATTPVRATVHNLCSSPTKCGILIITGGTIISDKQEAVNNVGGTLTVGSKGGNIDTTTPLLIGATYGANNDNVFNFYDGILKGRQSAISGNITELEDNTTVQTSIETIDGYNYYVAYLQ